MDLLLPFVAALAISMAVIPVMVRLAPRLGMIDKPDPRKVHQTPIPRVGGMGIVLGALIPVFLWMPHDRRTMAFLAAGLVLLVFGVWDDIKELGHYAKFLGQIAAVTIVVYYGHVYVTLLPFMGLEPVPDALGQIFTVFAMVGVINALNHSDGLDGLAGGEALLSLGCIGYLAHDAGGAGLLVIAAATVGGIFGFLRFNSHPARVFMGDGGSQFLGFTLAYLVVQLTQKVNPALSPALPALILGLPVIDILAVLYLRISSGRNWFRATKNHIHHRLMGIGFDHHGAVVIIYMVQTFFVISAVALRYQLDSAVLGLYGAVSIGLFVSITVAERRRWRLAARSRLGRMDRIVERIKAHAYFERGPALLVGFLVPAYLLAATVLVKRVPADFGAVAVMLGILLIGSLLLRQRPGAVQNRLVVYVTVAFVVYLVGRYPTVPVPAMEAVDIVFFCTIAIALALAIRYHTEEVFRVTPMDYLVMLVVLFVGATTRGNTEGTLLAAMVVKTIIMFYAAEWLIERISARWNGLFVTTIMSLLVLGVRALL